MGLLAVGLVSLVDFGLKRYHWKEVQT
jgi:hypothetical protein